MNNDKKDTIYIDPEDDITGIIDRVNLAKSKIVALVLPKRAQVLHSSVNMRLLKRAAENKGKKLVLISTESSVVKLAAAAQIYIASSLKSKPELPKNTDTEEIPETVISDNEDENSNIDKSKSIGELAGVPVKEPIKQKEEEPIELDNVDVTEKDKSADKPKEKMNKRLKVPSIDKFRNRIFIGVGGLVIIGILYFVGMVILPKATITVKTNTSDLETKFELIAKTDVQTLDVDKKIFPAQLKELKTELSEKVTATGKTDKGNKATGKVTFFNCSKDDKLSDTPRTVPAGTGISSGDKTFITQTAVTIQPSGFTGNTCKSDKPSAEVSVTAAKGGDIYNLAARTYSVNGFATMSAVDSIGMSGGTSKLVSSISQEDVDAVKATLQKGVSDKEKEQLASQIKSAGLFPLSETFLATYEAPLSSPAVGEEATEGTVTLKATFTMLAIKESELVEIIKKSQESNITTATQKIYDNGLSKAKVGQLERKSSGESKLLFTATASVGPFIDTTEMAKEIKGKSAGETKSIIGERPGIDSVEVEYSPFWVYRTPNRLNQINIVIDGAGEVR